MAVAGFVRNSWRSGIVTGGLAAYIGMRVEPLRSHFMLAALAAVGMGVLAGIIEASVRRIATGR